MKAATNIQQPAQHQTLLVTIILGTLLLGETVHAQATAPPDIIAKALPTATPGDVLVIADGTYRDQVLEWRGKGSAERPVLVRAATPGGVIFSGQSSLLIDGEHLIVEGLLFTDGFAPGKEAISISGSRNTLRHCVVASYNPPPSGSDREDKWLALRGQDHRVEHCTFYNKTSPSVTVTVWRKEGQLDRHTLYRNHFHTRPKGSTGNGFETIRIGTSDTTGGDSQCVIEGNRFFACDGEMEIISVKSDNNLISENSFVECAGTITLRHGDGSTISRNVIAGKLKKETGGIRVYGARHQILENVIIGTTGRADGAIALMCGEQNPEPSGYQPVVGAIVRGNLLVANKGPALELAAEFDESKRPVLPRQSVVDANTLSGENQATLVSGLNRPGIGVGWTRNQIFMNNQVPREFTQNRPGLISAERVGAEWFRNRLR
jgi:poly(beta-D-mannuronate) lyase